MLFWTNLDSTAGTGTSFQVAVFVKIFDIFSFVI